MKSFYQHLRASHEFGEPVDLIRKPIFRSSAIFPVVNNDSYTSRIIFLGYWFVKRKINEVNLLMTLRDKEGNALLRKTMIIDSPRTYSIEIDHLLREIQHGQKSNFVGSIEVEIFSTRDMVFPYPALVVSYYSDKFNTCVHTTGRIYNDFEDLAENERFRVPETGFDIQIKDDVDSFIAFVNGPKINPNGIIKYTITNSDSQKFSGVLQLGTINPYQTMFVKFKDHIPNLSEKLNHSSGTITIEHNFEGFFPRFLAGNVQVSFPSVSFTHTYYDCSSCADNSDYWDRMSDQYHDCSAYIPIFADVNLYTELVIYPNFSPSDFKLHITFHDEQGKQLHQLNSFLEVDSKNSKLIRINFNDLIKEHKLEFGKIKSAHVISDFRDRIPARLKFGLNVGVFGSKARFPCNICFNAKVGNPLLENKPGSFHWCPLFDEGRSIVTISNFSPQKYYQKSANLKVKFYNEKGFSGIEKNIVLPPYGEFRLDTIENSEIKSLLQDGIVWITIEANNPNIQGFYFNFNQSGAVAGDHFF